MGEQIKIKTQL